MHVIRMLMSPRQIFAIYLAMGAATLVGPVHGTPVLDQEHDTAQTAGLTVANDRTQIQSFTVGMSGWLDRIDVEVEKQPETVEDLKVALWTSDASGLPIDSILSTTFASSFIADTFLSWDISAAAIPVSVGDVFAVVLDSDAPNNPPLFLERYHWAFGGQYDRGRAHTQFGPFFLGLEEDLQFRTFVSVPEPNSVVLVMLAIGSLLGSGRQMSARRDAGAKAGSLS